MFKIITCALAILLSIQLQAQLMPFKNYGVKDGLNDNNVQAIIKDNRGLLWLGTDFGVYWFDGKRFYQPEIKTNIGQQYVNGFYKDWNNAIWVLTFFNGIYKFQDNHFTNYLPDTLEKDITKNTATYMQQVAPKQYVVIRDGTPYSFDEQKFTIFDSSNIFLRSKTNSVTLLSNSMLLISTEFGIFLYQVENGVYKLSNHFLKERSVSKILIADNQLWVATGNGLLAFENVGKNSFSQLPGNYLPGKEIKDIVKGGDNKIWVLADTVYKIDHKKITSYNTTNGLPENIKNLYCDDEGLTWFAHQKGISVLGDEYYEFTPVMNDKNDKAMGPVNTDRAGNLWIGTAAGFVTTKDKGYTIIKKAGNDMVGYVSCIYKTQNNVLLAGTSTGIYSIDAEQIKKEFNLSAPFITEDKTGRKWFAENNGHIWISSNTGIKPLYEDHFTEETVSGLYPVKDVVWIGYRGTGIKKYRLSNDSLVLVKEFNATSGFSDCRVRCCAADKRGNILFGTRTNGIFIFSANDDSLIAHLTTQNGLSANWVKDIICDADGTLYLATNNGINILSGDYKNPVIRQLKINNENINRETNFITKIENVFYISTNEGILKWIPENMGKDTTAPPVYFTRIEIQGLRNFVVDPYTIDAGGITLSYDQHIISFEFAGINLKNPEDTRYQYMLEGQNSEWGQPSEYNYVAYNLKPGSYVFKVVAKNSNGTVSRRAAIFHFVIRPPFWNTWWFITGCAIIMLLIAYAAYRYKVKQILKIEFLRNKISADLHDDIGSTLSSISILSDMALKETSNTNAEQMIRGISENSTLLLEKMDDIVWSINPKNDTLENLMVRFRRFASVLLEAKRIQYNFEVSPAIKNLKLSMDYRQHIYLILKEAINNLVKYAHCSRVKIEVGYRHGMLGITVEDNGIGFDEGTAAFGNGIINMRQRAALMHATVTITSQQGKGTTIYLQLKIK